MPAIPAVLPNPRAGTSIQRLQPKEVSDQGSGGRCPPWLIARGPSLGVPRLDRVALHHGSFGSDGGRALRSCPDRIGYCEPERLEQVLWRPSEIYWPRARSLCAEPR